MRDRDAPPADAEGENSWLDEPCVLVGDKEASMSENRRCEARRIMGEKCLGRVRGGGANGGFPSASSSASSECALRAPKLPQLSWNFSFLISLFEPGFGSFGETIIICIILFVSVSLLSLPRTKRSRNCIDVSVSDVFGIEPRSNQHSYGGWGCLTLLLLLHHYFDPIINRALGVSATPEYTVENYFLTVSVNRSCFCIDDPRTNNIKYPWKISSLLFIYSLSIHKVGLKRNKGENLLLCFLAVVMTFNENLMWCERGSSLTREEKQYFRSSLLSRVKTAWNVF